MLIFTSRRVDSFLPIARRRLQSSISSKVRPPEESPHRTCRASRGESDSSTLEVSGGLLVVVFEASRQTAKPAARTIETSPDKKMRVGSLRSPREYDDRLPPDVDSSLNLVIPRFEEPPKKTGGRVDYPHGRS